MPFLWKGRGGRESCYGRGAAEVPQGGRSIDVLKKVGKEIEYNGVILSQGKVDLKTEKGKTRFSAEKGICSNHGEGLHIIKGEMIVIPVREKGGERRNKKGQE